MRRPHAPAASGSTGAHAAGRGPLDMPSQSIGILAPSLDSSAETARRLRNRGLANVLRMGHCAPSIMQAMLDVSETDAQWLVKLTAGLPGGIGNTGGECGGVTAPLVLLGLRYGQEKTVQGLPVVVYKGHDVLRRFTACQGTTACREIRGEARVPVRCIGVVRQAPVLCAECIGADCTAAISASAAGSVRSPLRALARAGVSLRARGVSSPGAHDSRQRGAAQWQFGFHGRDSLHRDDLQCAHRWRHGARPDAR